MYLLDRSTGTIALVSTAYDGGVSRGHYPTISGDGTTIAYFAEPGDNVIAGITNSTTAQFDLCEKELASGAVQEIDIDNAGDDMQGGAYSQARASAATAVASHSSRTPATTA